MGQTTLFGRLVLLLYRLKAPGSRGLPEQDADLFVEACEDVRAGLVHNVAAKIFTDNAVP